MKLEETDSFHTETVPWVIKWSSTLSLERKRRKKKKKKGAKKKALKSLSIYNVTSSDSFILTVR